MSISCWNKSSTHPTVEWEDDGQRSYTKQKNNREFNKIKELASDATNLAFRTVIQMGGKDGREETNAKQTHASNKELMKSLGMKPKAERRTKQQITADMQAPFVDAIDKLYRNDCDPTQAKLSKPECCAVLTLGFNTYTSQSSKKVDALRKDVAAAIAKDYSEATKKPDYLAKMEARKKKGATEEAAAPKKKRKAKAPSDGGDAQKGGKKTNGDGGAGKKKKAKATTGDAGGGTKRKRDDSSSGGCDGGGGKAAAT